MFDDPLFGEDLLGVGDLRKRYKTTIRRPLTVGLSPGEIFTCKHPTRIMSVMSYGSPNELTKVHIGKDFYNLGRIPTALLAQTPHGSVSQYSKLFAQQFESIPPNTELSYEVSRKAEMVLVFNMIQAL